jgi:hypothetical protein
VANRFSHVASLPIQESQQAVEGVPVCVSAARSTRCEACPTSARVDGAEVISPNEALA